MGIKIELPNSFGKGIDGEYILKIKKEGEGLSISDIIMPNLDSISGKTQESIKTDDIEAFKIFREDYIKKLEEENKKVDNITV